MLGRIFGSKKAIDSGISAIDAMVYTGEEKSAAQLEFLKLYEPFNLAQRDLACIVVPPYMLAFFIAFGMSCFGLDTTAQQALLSGRIGDSVMLIVAFYYGGGAAESVFKFLTRK